MTAQLKTYEDGLLEGRLAALERMTIEHKGRLDNHATRLRAMERILWVLLGAYLLVQMYPALQNFITP